MSKHAQVQLFSLENTSGLKVQLGDFGAAIVTVEMADSRGDIDVVNLGFSDPSQYLANPRYFGATMGRCCGRIANAQFDIDGKTFSVSQNHGKHHIHGGNPGFSHTFWLAEPSGKAIRFQHSSPSGDQGYPGKLDVMVTYSITDENELICDYQATTDQATPINLTNHSYWNLSGMRGKNPAHQCVLDHHIQLNARHYLEMDPAMIPTGRLLQTAQSPFDFSLPQLLDNQMQKLGSGFDHCFVIDKPESGLALAGIVTHPESGRVLTVRTTQPAFQFYTANILDGSRSCGDYPAHSGLCLETQHFPDSPHHPNFPTTLLRPGETFHQTTIFGFSTL